jgi:hypothetical protein
MAIVVPIVSTWEPKGLQRSIADIKKAEGAWGKTGAAFKAMAVPAAAVGGALAIGAKKAVTDASNLGETFNAVNKVFGEGAKTITDFGAQASKSAGLSQREFQQLATTTGSLFTNMGQSQQEAADNTVLLTQRAADMASVFNTDVGDALEAINAGLRGESEPLRRFGVGLSDAAIKAKAMELGLYAGTGALDGQARAAATQALILEQTAKTQGDFADTSESMANAGRTLQADMENLSASLGEALLPVMETAIAIGIRMVQWIKDNEEAFKALVAGVAIVVTTILGVNAAMKAYEAATTVAGLAADAYRGAMKLLNAEKTKAIALWVKEKALLIANKAAMLASAAAQATLRAATVAYTAVQWALNAALTANPIGLVIAAIAALVAGIVLAYKRSETFRNIVDGAFRAVGKAVSWLGEKASAAFKKIYDWVQKIIAKGRELKDSLSFSLPSFGGIFGRSSYAVGYTSGTPSTRRATPGSPIVINISGALDPVGTAKQIKRILETYDGLSGREPGAALARAW